MREKLNLQKFEKENNMIKNIEIFEPLRFNAGYLTAMQVFNSLETDNDVPLSSIFDGIHEFSNPRTMKEIYELHNFMENHPSTVSKKEVYAIRLIERDALVSLPEVELVVDFETPFDIREVLHNVELSHRVYREICHHGMNELPEIYGMETFKDLRPVHVMVSNTFPDSYKENEAKQAIQGTYKVNLECVPKNHLGSAWVFLGVVD